MFHLHIVSVIMGLLGLLGCTGLPYSTFEEWVDVSLSVELPEGIEAFCFNLYEDGGGKWSVEIVGAASFDREDSDWACDEVFTNRTQPLRWSSNQSWERILAQVKSHIKKYLKKGKYASLLLGKQGIGVGFVDGDLILL
jgi:shikimate kinase